MSRLAETAELLAVLKLRDQLSRPLGSAVAGVKRAEAGVGRLNSRVTALGGGVRTAGRNLGRFVGSTAGILGLTIGLAGAAKGLETVIGKASEFGAQSQDFARLTGLSIPVAAQFVDVLDKYGVAGEAGAKAIGFLERNSQTLAGTQKKALAFQKAYGFSLTDNKGRIEDANELLLRTADYFTSGATASQKATVLAKLYGRSWQQLIPLLAKGRKGIEAEFKTALHLTPQQIKQTIALRNSQRELNDTWGDTEVLIGLALTPTITKAVRALNSFVGQNQGQIVGLFEGLAKFAGEVADGVRTFVIPTIRGIAGAWNAIPPEFRRLLITGFIANKALKMTIGFDPIDIARKSVTEGVSKIVGGFFGRGSPGNPMWVAEVGGGLGGGGKAGVPGGAVAAGGAASKVGRLAGGALGALAIIGSVLGVVTTQQEVSNSNSEQALGVQQQGLAWLKTQPKRDDLVNGLKAVDQGIAEIRSNPLNVLVQGDALARLEALRAEIAAQIAATYSLAPHIDAIAGAIGGLPAFLGSAIQQGRGTGPEGRRIIADNSGGGRVGIEKNRGRNGGVNVNVNVATDHRQNSHAASTQLRYGPTPATSGAR